jgi:hypothetical protein
MVHSPFHSLWWSFALKDSWVDADQLLQVLATNSQVIYSTDEINMILRILNLGQQLDVTDERDHVYALLGQPTMRGLFKEAFQPHFMYLEQTTAEKVCWQVTLRLCRTDESVSGTRLNFLAWIDNDDNDENDLQGSFQSWIPQWHKKRIYNNNPFMHREVALFDETAELVTISFSKDHSHLHVAALILNSYIIRHASDVLQPKDFISKSTGVLEALWRLFSSSLTREQSESSTSWISFIWALVC